MEASWKGSCCGAEQSVCLGFAEARGRIPVPKAISHRCPKMMKGFEMIKVCMPDADEGSVTALLKPPV